MLTNKLLIWTSTGGRLNVLDKKTNAVLQLLRDKTENAYKVLDKNQMVDELAKYKIDLQGLIAIITFLTENEYVSVKYQDKEEICIATTIKADSYLDGEKDLQQKAKLTNAQSVFLFVGMFVAAFLGALIAGLIGKLL